jgi:hypothetical protein
MRDIYTQTVDEFKAQLRFAIEQIEQSTEKSMLPAKIHSVDESEIDKNEMPGLAREDLLKMSRDAAL